MTDAWQRHRFSEGLARALIAVRRPLLLVLDNVQWCDQETMAFVTFCLTLADDAQLWWPRPCARKISAKTASSPGGSSGCGPLDC